jgi:hypothetical protein
MTDSRTIIAVWDSYAIAQERAGFLREDDPGLSESEAFEQACLDTDQFQFEWEDMTECLTDALHAVAPEGRFHVEGRNMGWQRRSGYKVFTAHDGQTFLDELLPCAECTFTIERAGDTLYIRNAHHDAPCGEYYTVTVAPAGDGEP